MQQKYAPQQQAFSLVELAIVLVILGLLIGAILGGKALIRAAELRTVTRDINNYSTAIYSFRDKYQGLPGDITNATSFWGTDPDGCPTNTVRTAKTTTCNGNGDGQVNLQLEAFHSWQQLADAGMIEGSFTGQPGAASTVDADPGSNVPALKFNSGQGCITYNQLLAGAYYYYGTGGNVFMIGLGTSWECIEPFFTPEEAWNIDTKLDDGKPGTGRLRPRNAAAVGGAHTNCSNGTDSTAATAQSAVYTLTYTSAACGLHMLFQ